MIVRNVVRRSAPSVCAASGSARSIVSIASEIVTSGSVEKKTACAMITGYAAAFVLSLNEYIISFLVAGFTVETLPVKIVNGLRYGFTPTIAAVAVVFIVIAATTFTLFAIFGNLMKFLGADPEILEKNG